MRFTYSQELKNLPLGEHHDSKTTGLSLIVRASGRNSWTYVYREKGIQKRLTLGRLNNIPLREARELVGKHLHASDGGTCPYCGQAKPQKEPSITFQELAAKYITGEAREVQRLWPQTKSALRHPRFDVWNNRAIASIRQSEVSNLLSDSTSSNGSYNKIRALLHCVFRFACELELVSNNPVASIKTRKALSRDRVLSDQELRSAWSVPYFRLVLLTGQRPTNCARIRRSQIVEDLWKIPAYEFKTHQTHIVPLVKSAVDTLNELPNRGDKYFTLNDSLGTQAALAELGIPNAKPKDLQRTVRTRLAMLQVSPDTAERIQGHSLRSYSRDIRQV